MNIRATHHPTEPPDVSGLRQSRLQKTDMDAHDPGTQEAVAETISRSARGTSADDILRKVDANKDGSIDAAEDQAALISRQHAQVVRRPEPPPNEVKTAQELFNASDTDSDGKITKDELSSVLKKLDRPSEHAANEVFSAADSDRDERISQAELEHYVRTHPPSPSKLSGSQAYDPTGRPQPAGPPALSSLDAIA